MNTSRSRIKSGISVKSARKLVQKAAETTSSALAIVAKELHRAPRLAKRARVSVKGLSRRTTRLVKSNPVGVLLGASAIGFILAKLKLLA